MGSGGSGHDRAPAPAYTSTRYPFMKIGEPPKTCRQLDETTWFDFCEKLENHVGEVDRDARALVEIARTYTSPVSKEVLAPVGHKIDLDQCEGELH